MSKVLLIAGHGAGDPGVPAEIMGMTYYEADETRKLVQSIVSFCKGKVDVSTYPTYRDAYQDAQNNTLLSVAQFQNYDYVLEIHFNGFNPDKNGDGKQMGTEIYRPNQYDDDGSLDREILECVTSVGIKSRGVKTKAYTVIANARSRGAKANLLEVCFLDDADDMAVYQNRANMIASNIANVFASWFPIEKEDDEVAEKRYQTINEVPSWAQPTVQKMMDKGILAGTDGGLDFSLDMIRQCVFNDRAGLYDLK